MVNLLKKLTDRVWYLPADHDTDRPVLGAVIGDLHTLIIDAGNSSEHAKLFLEQLEQLKPPHSKILVITHWHWDHIFGMKEMGLPALSHSLTKNYIEVQKGYAWTEEALDERVQSGEEIEFCATMIKKEFNGRLNEIEIVSPVITFEEELVIDLGGITAVVKHVGGDHAEDSSVIFVREKKVLFLGDCHSPDIYKPKRQYTPNNLLNLLEKLKGFDAEIALHSHSEPQSREEFFGELYELKVITENFIKLSHNKVALEQKIEQTLNRSLNDDDWEFIEYLHNGIEVVPK